MVPLIEALKIFFLLFFRLQLMKLFLIIGSIKSLFLNCNTLNNLFEYLILIFWAFKKNNMVKMKRVVVSWWMRCYCWWFLCDVAGEWGNGGEKRVVRWWVRKNNIVCTTHNKIDTPLQFNGQKNFSGVCKFPECGIWKLEFFFVFLLRILGWQI